jgi:hypothetical protein
MARDLKRLGTITECRFYYVPYWRIRAKIDGHVAGEVDHGDEAKYMKRDLITAEGSMTWTKIAIPAGDIGINFLKEPNIVTQPFDNDIGPALEATVSKNEALNLCETDIENTVIKRMRVEKVIDKKFRFLPRNVRLIFYPLWFIKYNYGDSIYPVMIDGASGAVVAGRAPGDLLLRRICLAVNSIIVSSLIALTLWVYYFKPNMCCGVMIVDAMRVFCIFILDGYYRHGGEIRRGMYKDVYLPNDYLEKQGYNLDVEELRLKTIYSERIPGQGDC